MIHLQFPMLGQHPWNCDPAPVGAINHQPFNLDNKSFIRYIYFKCNTASAESLNKNAADHPVAAAEHAAPAGFREAAQADTDASKQYAADRQNAHADGRRATGRLWRGRRCQSDRQFRELIPDSPIYCDPACRRGRPRSFSRLSAHYAADLYGFGAATARE